MPGLPDETLLGRVRIRARRRQRAVDLLPEQDRGSVVPRRIPGDGSVPVGRPALDRRQRFATAGRAAGEIGARRRAGGVAGIDEEDGRVVRLLDRVAAEVSNRLVVDERGGILRAEGVRLVAGVAGEGRVAASERGRLIGRAVRHVAGDGGDRAVEAAAAEHHHLRVPDGRQRDPEEDLRRGTVDRRDAAVDEAVLGNRRRAGAAGRGQHGGGHRAAARRQADRRRRDRHAGELGAAERRRRRGRGVGGWRAVTAAARGQPGRDRQSPPPCPAARRVVHCVSCVWV